MTTSSGRPYAGLDPQRVIQAIESLGLHCDGRVLALNSYENRVFRVGIEDAAPRVVKFYRPARWSDAAIIEEHAFTAELAENGVSVVPPEALHGQTLHHDRDLRFALFALHGGHAPELGRADTLRTLGLSLGRMHALGARTPFVHRPALSIERFGEEPVDTLLDGDWLPPELEANFEILAEAVLDQVQSAFERVEPVATIRLHGDCHPGNILWRGEQAHFVDLDDCMNGPAVQDLWMLLSGSSDEQSQQLRWLLEGYEVFAPFNSRELGLIEALRSLRLLHFNAWIARRWHDPAFPAAFPWFAEPRHWEQVIGQLQEQLALLQEPTLLRV
ncbi:MAG: serine/threonine protein kinase [Lysobacterales bacterium CG_4_10_14_3_um_filter_64_11]|nr:MAG: serine/threonine protein kinase [Xanthomonadales bacterium CG_4_10_14_3_um_filter_64_11]